MFAEGLIRDDKKLAAIMGATLMATTYFVFSVRTLFLTNGVADWISAKRFIATAVGAAAFLLIARFANRISLSRVPMRALAFSIMIAAAIGTVLTVRIAWDSLFDESAIAVLEANARWVITWSGYFSAALVGYFLLVRIGQSYVRQTIAKRADIVSMANEVTAWSPGDRAALLAMLTASTQYEEADPLPSAAVFTRISLRG